MGGAEEVVRAAALSRLWAFWWPPKAWEVQNLREQ